jgi:hypothetical protein
MKFFARIINLFRRQPAQEMPFSKPTDFYRDGFRGIRSALPVDDRELDQAKPVKGRDCV